MFRKCRLGFTVRQWDQRPGINQFILQSPWAYCEILGHIGVRIGIKDEETVVLCASWAISSPPLGGGGRQPQQSTREGANIDGVFWTAKLSKLLYLKKCFCKI